MPRPRLSLLGLLVALTPASPCFAQSGPASFDVGFQTSVRPFLASYCSDCHTGTKAKGGLDLGAYGSAAAVAADLRRWEMVLEHLESGAMPPGKAKQQPPPELRRAVIAWVRDLRRAEAKRHAGDPGPVPPRRLSNAEYDHTIRDLTGVDIRPAQEFPVDPANEAGFDNSAESLALPPPLVHKYLEAARRVAEHLVLRSDGFCFAEYPVVADTDRDKYCVRQIMDFYRRQRLDHADYFQAAWRFKHRAQPQVTLTDIASRDGLSPKYLTTVWEVLAAPEKMGPVAALQSMWQELPGARGDSKAVRAGCERMRDFVVKLREQLVPDVKNLTSPRVHNGSQPLVLWKNRQVAANRMRYRGGAFDLKLDALLLSPAAARALTPGATPAARQQYEATFARFCAVFPDQFVVTERARVYLDPVHEKKLTGRLLNAGFHSMTGYFRDDGPLYELVLSRAEQAELDRLWLDFDVITGAPLRQHTSFIWFERSDSSFIRDAQFDGVRAEDQDCTSEKKIKEFGALYLAKARECGGSEVALAAIEDHFKIVNAQIRRVANARSKAEPSHLDSLQAFAARAYRRALSADERSGLVAFYRSLRAQDGLSHEEALRDALVSVLMSPHFLFRVEAPLPGSGVRPLSDVALASRLSYFLWASMPDAELLARATGGDLHQPDVLATQTRRMLRDPKVRGLATEFLGNWLDVRRFEEHNAVDRQRFPSFTDELRRAMFEEPIRFVVDVAHSDRSVLELLDAAHTFVNPVLARHYGMPEPKGGDWQRIDDARAHGRGGLLPMAAFLTRNAPGLRTSPVKRGYWVVRRVLGEKIPAPPPEVPELPADEAKLGELTLREVLARHRADRACAGCHERFDSIGLAFEGYGPIGERRTVDLGGRRVDTRAVFPGGGAGDGLDGLRRYLEGRQEEFVTNLCRQFLAYALGRTLLPSDDFLIDDMRLKLARNEYRFSSMIEAVVTSRQFLNKRGG